MRNIEVVESTDNVLPIADVRMVRSLRSLNKLFVPLSEQGETRMKDKFRFFLKKNPRT